MRSCSRRPPAHAFTIEHSATRYADKHYQCELTVMLDAPLERVEAVLRDYEQYPSLDARILEARVLERPDANVAMLETTLRACFGPFCRNVKRIERVEEIAACADGRLPTPARSDVRFGETHTSLAPVERRHSRDVSRRSITPGFWVPPFVGRRWMLSTLEDATQRAVQERGGKRTGEAAEASGPQ